MVEEYYYLNKCSGEMEKTSGWKKQEFRLFRNGEVWCPRHNHFEYIWNDSNGVTITSRQCSIQGFPIKYDNEVSLYGCRLIRHNEDMPLQVSFYVVIRKDIQRKIKLKKIEIRMTLSVADGIASMVFPGRAVVKLDVSKLVPRADGVFADNTLIYDSLHSIGYDMPEVLQNRIIEILRDEEYKISGLSPEDQCGLKGMELFFAFIERPNDPCIATLKNFAGRHFDQLFPRDEKDNYCRLCDYIGLNEMAAQLFHKMFEEDAYTVIVLRLMYELNIEDEKEIIDLTKLVSSRHYDNIFLIPFRYFQLLPTHNLKLSIIQTDEYDYEKMYYDVCCYLELVKKKHGDRILMKIISENCGYDHFKELWIVGDIISNFLEYGEIISRGLSEKILSGVLNIDTYNEIVTELSEKKIVNLLSELDNRLNNTEDEIYSYKFRYVRTSQDISRIEELFNVMLTDDSINTEVPIMYEAVYFNDKLECVIEISGRRVIRVCSSEGEQVTGKLRTACRTWAKKFRFHSDVIDKN